MILCPHGGFSLLVATLSSMAYLTTVSHDGCDFARITGPPTIALTAPYEYPFVELGFNSFRTPVFYEELNEWQIRYSDKCRSYDSIASIANTSEENEKGDNGKTKWKFDIFWKFGHIAHQIGLILGGSACLFLWTTAICIPITELNWKLLGLQIGIAALFHLGSFLWFFNDLCFQEGGECHWFYGSNTSIGSLVLYLFSSICILCKYPEPKVVKMVRSKVKEDFQQYEYSVGTGAMTEYDDASGIQSLGFQSAASSRGGRGYSDRSRSQKKIIV